MSISQDVGFRYATGFDLILGWHLLLVAIVNEQLNNTDRFFHILGPCNRIDAKLEPFGNKRMKRYSSIVRH